MKFIILLSLIAAFINLDAQLVTRSKHRETTPLAYTPLVEQIIVPAAAPAEAEAPVEIELHVVYPDGMPAPSAPSPSHKTAHEPTAPASLATAAPPTSTALQPLYPILPPKQSMATAAPATMLAAISADSKHAHEAIIIPASILAQIAQQDKEALEKKRLETLIRNKIKELYPKWPLDLYPGIIQNNVEFQLKTPKLHQEFTLRNITVLCIELYSSCIPIINCKNKIASLLKEKYPNLSEPSIETRLTDILQRAIKPKYDAIHLKHLQKQQNSCCFQADYAHLIETHKKISALPDPKDKQLLEETVDIILEEPKPDQLAAPAKPSSGGCVIL